MYMPDNTKKLHAEKTVLYSANQTPAPLFFSALQRMLLILSLGMGCQWPLRVLIPFIVVTVAGVVDNIGDCSACQSANDPHFKKPDWRSIENGIRGNALGSVLSALIGGPIQSTATTNIGIASAGGITSRKVAYLASIMLMIALLFPGLTNVLSMIPTPVLGAVLVFSCSYIMCGGFSALGGVFEVSQMILKKMFDDVQVRVRDGVLSVDVSADL